jgi:tetratricopeptide (TPR) repeat protein
VPHFVEAELILGGERSAHYSVLAGEQALAFSAAHQALLHFERALTAVGDDVRDETMGPILWGLTRSQAATYEPTRTQVAFDTLTQAFDRYVEIGDNEKAAEIAGYPFGLQTRLLGTLPVYERALKLVEPDSLMAGRILARGIQPLWYERQDTEAVETAFNKTVEIARANGDTALEGQALLSWYTARHLGSRNDVLNVLENLHEALSHANSNQDTDVQAQAGIYLTFGNVFLGRLQQAVDSGRAARDASDRGGNAGWKIIPNMTLSAAFLAQGDWVNVESNIAQAPSADSGNLLTNSRVLKNVAESHRGSLTEIDDLTEMIYGTDDLEHEMVGQLLMMVALVNRAKPDPEVSQVLLDLVRISETSSEQRTIGSIPYMWYGVTHYCGVGPAAVIQGDIGAAQRAYDDLEPWRSLMWVTSTDRILGLFAQTLGKHGLAIQHFEDALKFCRDGGARPELAWTCSDYAEMLLDRDEPGDREKANALQDEALAITQELGMRPLTERILARREILRA